MSLILDALNRAERERQKHQPIPDINTRHDPVPPRVLSEAEKPPLKRSYLLIVIVVALLLGAAVWLIWGRAAPEPARSSMALPAETLANARPIETLPSRAAPDTPVATPRPAVKDPLALPSRESAEPETAPVAAESRVAPASSADLEQLYADARQTPESPPAPEVIIPAAQALYAPEPEPVPEFQVEPVAPILTSSPAPVAIDSSSPKSYASLIDLPDIGDLPWGMRQEIPSINYARHNVDGPSDASVVINGQAFRSGQPLAADLMLEEIYSDGVIIRFKQTRFKLRALNSWINM